MAESDDEKVSWDFKLDFDLPKAPMSEPPKPPAPPKIPPKILLKERFPRILERIEILWGTMELHKYFEQTLYTDRSNRQGFPEDVMEALGELHNEHYLFLKKHKLISEDVWDMQFRK